MLRGLSGLTPTTCFVLTSEQDGGSSPAGGVLTWRTGGSADRSPFLPAVLRGGESPAAPGGGWVQAQSILSPTLQEPRADSSDKGLLFCRRGLGNVPGCLSIPGVSQCWGEQHKPRALAPCGRLEQGEAPPPP